MDFDIYDMISDNEVLPAPEETAAGETDEILSIEEEVKSVSSNEMIDILKSIDEKLERIGESTSENSIEYVSVSGSDVLEHVSDYVSGNTLTLSEDNILHKSLNEYNTQEALLLVNFTLFLFFGILLGIRKAVFKWK